MQTGVCGRCVMSAFNCVRRACDVMTRRSQPLSSPATTTTTATTSTTSTSQFHHTVAPPRGERKCGDGVDSACVEPSPTHHATAVITTHTHNAPGAAATTTTDDVINCCSDDDDTVTSSVAADCVTETSALTSDILLHIFLLQSNIRLDFVQGLL